MASCDGCDAETDEIKVFGKGRTKQRLCDDCYEDAARDAEIAREAEDAMGGMMEYKG